MVKKGGRARATEGENVDSLLAFQKYQQNHFFIHKSTLFNICLDYHMHLAYTMLAQNTTEKITNNNEAITITCMHQHQHQQQRHADKPATRNSIV